MSIFSSWLAAPNSGVMTYSETSTWGTIAASPCPMPEVSTTTRSNPATRQAATASGSAAAISAPEARVASERMKICLPWIAFMRMRSPSNAPPVFRREGSTATIAIFSRSD